MAVLNRITLIGNLARDPQLRTTKAGDPVGQLIVGTSRSVRRGSASRSVTDWHTVVVWGRLAEHCGAHLTKGRQVYVEGRLNYRRFVDDDGIERRAPEIIADSVQFLGPPTPKLDPELDQTPPPEEPEP